MAKPPRRPPRARSRRSKRGRATPKARAGKVSPKTHITPPVSRAETLLLALARDLSTREPAAAGHPDLGKIVNALARAYAPDAPLAKALRKDWLKAHDDKTAVLAFAWAREQVRLALIDVLNRARGARAAADTDTTAWLWLAACEALAHEPPSAVSDRAHALAAFLSAS
jgi:hypothetical protein